MTIQRTLSSRWPLALALAAVFAGSAAQAAVGAQDTARQRYLQERAACLDGRSHQDRATCLREATNAYDEARRPRSDPASTTPDRATLERNAVQRCALVAPADREDCRRLALGEGTRSGSVEGGGVIKEIVTVIPGQ